MGLVSSSIERVVNPFRIPRDDSIAAQNALAKIQSQSAKEAHEWTDEEIDELIANHRQSKRKQ